MWQAISHLLSEQLGEGEIELRNELPGGEIHAAWHLRYAGRDFFVKCDERELLPIFTAEADQLELLSRSKTVSVPEVFVVGSDRDYSFLVMEYLQHLSFWDWLAFGTVLLILEVFGVGGYLLWTGLAAAIVGAVAHKQYSEMGVGQLCEKLVPNGVFADVKSFYDPAALEAAGAKVWRL